MERLFVYGTLRQPEVQVGVFGREVAGSPAALVGYRLERLKVKDSGVVALSGSDDHPILVPGSSDDRVQGVVLEITPEELARADAYEVDDYARVQADLKEGGTAWVYAAALEPA